MLSDRDIAVRILALSDVVPGENPKNVLAYFDCEFDRWAAKEHSSDCGSRPQACARCVHDGAMKRVPHVRTLFGI